MRLFTLYMPNESDVPARSQNATRLSAVTALHDGINPSAFAFPLLWAIFKGLWVEAIIIALLGLASLLLLFMGLIPHALVLSLIVRVYFLLEANRHVAMRLFGKGYEPVGLVEAGDGEEAIARFFGDFDDNDNSAVKADPVKKIHAQTITPPSTAGLLLFGDEMPGGAQS